MEKKLPKGWVETSLLKISNVFTGKKDANHGTVDGRYPFFTCAFEPLKSPDFSYDSEVMLLPGNGANVGEVFYYKGKFQAYQRTYIVDNIEINHRYLFYHLKHNWKIRNANQQYGSATNYIKIGNFNDYSVEFPPLPEQERIVAKLDKLFAQHEMIKKALDRIPQLLKAFRQQVLTQAVTGKLTNVSVIENKMISDFFDVKTGATPKKGVSKYYENATVPWIKSGEVKNAFIYNVQEFITETAVKETNAKVFPKDTILVAMYGEGKTRGQVGWMKVEAATNQAIAALVNKDLNEWTRRYIYLFCLSQYNEIRSKAEGGNQPNLNLSKIKNWEISIPQKLVEQEEIVCRVESLFAKADAIEARYQILKAKIDNLPQAILRKAFKGELVPQLPTDGDAKDLLADIMALKKEVKGKVKGKK